MTYKEARQELLRLELAGKVYATMSIPSANVATSKQQQASDGSPACKISDQRQKAFQQGRSNETKKCYNCNEPGHLAKDCQHQLRQQNLARDCQHQLRQQRSARDCQHQQRQQQRTQQNKHPNFCYYCGRRNHSGDECYQNPDRIENKPKNNVAEEQRYQFKVDQFDVQEPICLMAQVDAEIIENEDEKKLTSEEVLMAEPIFQFSTPVSGSGLSKLHLVFSDEPNGGQVTQHGDQHSFSVGGADEKPHSCRIRGTKAKPRFSTPVCGSGKIKPAHTRRSQLDVFKFYNKNKRMRTVRQH